MSINVVDPAKLRTKRENQHLSLSDVVTRADKKFTRGALSAWENGDYKPSNKNLPSLLKALGCEFEEISSPFTVQN